MSERLSDGSDDQLPATDDESGIRWGLGDAAMGWVLAIVLSSMAAIGTYLLIGTSEDTEVWFDQLSIVGVAMLQLPLSAVLIAWPLAITAWKGRGPVRDLRLGITGGDVWVGLGAGIGAQLALPLLYVPLLLLLGDADVSGPARDLSDRAEGVVGIVVLYLVVGVLAPISEELFYRGLVMRSLERRWGATAGLWGSALLFGAAHGQPVQFLGQAFFGLVAAYLVQRRGRLGPAVVAHLAFNLSAVTFLVVSG
jgi:membrane protease YdiL (CAAX protease family)